MTAPRISTATNTGLEIEAVPPAHGHAWTASTAIAQKRAKDAARRRKCSKCGETKSQPAGILQYVEDLRRGLNAEFGRKVFFEIASIEISACLPVDTRGHRGQGLRGRVKKRTPGRKP